MNTGTTRRRAPAWARLLALALVTFGASLIVTGQQVRDLVNAPPTAAGSARLTGQVVTADQTRVPVRRAIVSVRGGDRGLRSAVTDDAGRFQISGLEAGRYTIVATKPAFLDAAYGTTRPGRAGSSVQLASGQTFDITIVMSRGAALEGTVRDDLGLPLAAVTITALDVRDVEAAPAMAGRNDRLRTVTDDRGAYRLYGLLPGDYLIGATIGPGGNGDIGQRRDVEMSALLARLANRAGRGVAEPPARAVGYGPVYYPGVPVLSAAERVRLAVAEERRGLDFTFAPTAVSTIEGAVTRSDAGALADVQISFDVTGPTLSSVVSSQNMPMRLSNPPDASGQFKFSNVVPGRYTLIARTAGASMPFQGRGALPPGATMMTFGAGAAGVGGGSIGTAAAPAPGGPAPLFATVELDANGQNISGVALDLRPGVALTGRVVFDGGTLAPPDDLTAIRITLSQPRGSFMMISDTTRMGNGALSLPPATIQADGTMALRNIGPGTYALSGSILTPAGWWLRSAMVDGRDLLDSPLTVRSDSVDNVVFTFSDRRNELVGALEAAAGTAASDYFIVAVPADRSLWTSGPRRMKFTRPASDGTFTLRDLPAGDYLLAALTDFESRDFGDRSFLDEMAKPDQAIAVTVRDGIQTRQNLRVVR